MASGSVESKRKVPASLRTVLDVDAKWTKKCYDFFDRKYGVHNQKVKLKGLEVSCHGFVWIIGVFAMVYQFPELNHLWMNLLWLLIVDIIVVAVVKAFTRRRRPLVNSPDMFMTVSVDKFSFPSGHATRAVVLALFFSYLYPLPKVIQIPIFVWSGAVCCSRVFLGRHHILDVVGGIVIGIVEAILLSWTWIGEERADKIGKYLFGEDPWSSA